MAAEARKQDSPEGVTRIFIGGLGDGVKDSDVFQLFAPLGRVDGVDFVRSEGRAFGYMNFAPNSEKSLAKLFSTYNGCMWKGGRLRIEKAKEHYLERLKREWADDVEPPEEPVIDETPIDLSSSIRSKHGTTDKAQLHIFFPKLRKVKALPFKGTGKHKYSFQRILVPSLSSSLPVHFCDCEEHSGLSQGLAPKRLISADDQMAVINDEEINIINSVINKLLEKDEARSTILSDESKDLHSSLGNRGCPEDLNVQVLVDNVATEQEIDDEEDEDNLVTNIVGPKNSEEKVLKLMMLKSRSKPFEKRQVLVYKEDKQQVGKDHFPAPQKIQKVDQDHLPVSEKKIQEVDEDHLPSPEKKTKRSFSEALQQKAELEESKPQYIEERDEKSTLDRTKGQSCWTQKSSWKELVGDAGGSARSIFTLSQVLPGTGSTVPDVDEKKESGINSAVSTVTAIRPLKSAEAEKENEQRRKSTPAEWNAGESKRNPEKPQAFGSRQVRPFVRSRDSDKDWAKAKMALAKRRRNNAKVKEAT